MSFKKPKATANLTASTPAAPSPSSANAPSASNDVVNAAIQTKKRQGTLLASAPGITSASTLLGQGIR